MPDVDPENGIVVLDSVSQAPLWRRCITCLFKKRLDSVEINPASFYCEGWRWMAKSGDRSPSRYHFFDGRKIANRANRR